MHSFQWVDQLSVGNLEVSILNLKLEGGWNIRQQDENSMKEMNARDKQEKRPTWIYNKDDAFFSNIDIVDHTLLYKSS